jgi:hypothetical protein
MRLRALYVIPVLVCCIAAGAALAVEPVDLNPWTAESYPAVADFGAGVWTVAGDGQSVFQSVNGQPTLFVSDFDAFFSTFEGVIEVSGTDDDFIGFAIGYVPGDISNPAADYLLVDWKQGTQPYNFGAPSCTPGSTAPAGLAVSRVFGIPTADEFWGHLNFDAACSDLNSGLQELQRGFTLGNTGWAQGVPYTFKFEFLSNRLRVWVNGTLEIDIAGSFANGRFGFYNFSQAAVTYSGFTRTRTALLDIKPRSCPNPLNVKIFEDPPPNAMSKKGGVLPVAIVGDEGFDVYDMDVSSLLLEGVAPIRHEYEDVTTPVVNGEECDCTTDGADGFTDLVLKFRKSDIAAAIGSANDGDMVVLTVTGSLLDGTPFQASDCVRIINREAVPEPMELEPPDASAILYPASPNPFNPITRIHYEILAENFVSLDVYDVRGRHVETLVSARQGVGEYVVVWEAGSTPSGVYFYRLQAGDFRETRRMILLK